MAKELKVNCGMGEDAYTVVLTEAHANILDLVKESAAAKDKEGKELEGESLVTVILATAPYGVSSIKRFDKDGQLNDGPNGEYAVQEFKDGKAVTLEHFINDKRNDAPNGEAASWRLDDKGYTIVLRYKNGMCNDGPNGEPAYDRKSVKCGYVDVHTIGHYIEGKPNDGLQGEAALIISTANALYTAVRHYKDGKPCNGANGEPGIQNFSHGSLAEAWQIKDDGKKKALGSFARRKTQKKFGLSAG